MVQAVSMECNGQANRQSNVGADVTMPRLSTQPPATMNWQITLKDKIIAITGANRGIGLGIAEVCLANSASVVYSLDLMEPSEEFEALSKRNPGRFKYLQMDVTNEESTQRAIDAVVEAEGAIHGMICNAGMTKHQPALDFSMEQLEKLFKLNVFGAYSCATKAAKKFIELGVKGSIVSSNLPSYSVFSLLTVAKGIHSFDDLVQTKQSGTIGTIRRHQSCCPQHDAYAGHGVGTLRHPSEQHLARLREDGDDLLCRTVAGLGSEDAVLWRHA